MYGTLLAAVPWKDILKTAPAIVESARKLFVTLNERRRSRKSTPEHDPNGPAAFSRRIDEIKSRLDAVEADEAAQAELVSQMAVQDEALVRSIQALSARVTVLLWASGVAVLIAAIGIVIAVIT